MTQEEAAKCADAREKARWEGTTWDLSCRYCGLKKNVSHPELLALWDADPVFMKKYMEGLNRPEFREKVERAVAGVVRAMREEKKG